MQPGGFGGGQGNGYPPGGPPGYPGAPRPPGTPPQQQYGAAPPQHGAPQQPYVAPPQPGAPQQPYSAPQQPYGAPPPQYGAPPQPPYGAALPQPYGAPQPGQQYPGMPTAGQYGAPAHFSPGGLAGMPGTPTGPLPGGGLQMPGAPGHSSFGQAQSALAGAGGMMTAMKWGFVGIGVLCALGGIALAVMVDVVTGVSVAFTGAVFVVVALLVLPRFSGMLGQATAMVDGFAAKERLAQTGVPASGRLLSVQQTGRLVNYNPEIQAVVEVHHPQLGVYQTQTTAIVPQIAIPRAQPGAQVQVRVSPQNQHEIALVF